MLSLGLAWISPLVEAILLVKDDIAQPAQEVSFWGVPMRGIAPVTELVFGGGRILSGRVFPYLRIRLR